MEDWSDLPAERAGALGQAGVESFAGDLTPEEKGLALATQDRTVHPELQRFVAKRMGAKVHEVNSSHVPMLSQPEFVLDVIRQAAASVMDATVSKRA